jgi:hypothetical protein
VYEALQSASYVLLPAQLAQRHALQGIAVIQRLNVRVIMGSSSGLIGELYMS